MKTVSIKSVIIAGSFLVLSSATGFVSAHTLTGSLGASQGATDLADVTCSNDGNGAPNRVSTQIRDNFVAPEASDIVSAQTQRVIASGQAASPYVATNAVDTTNPTGTEGAVPAGYSALKTTIGGTNNTAYRVTISKTGASAETYTAEIHCQTSTGVHTGTVVTVRQNQ